MEDEDYDDDLEVDNPLNGYMDVITMDRIISPAISPSGQVMGMASWVKCLKEYGAAFLEEFALNRSFW